MLQILREYVQDGYTITEYTRDGETISHTVKTAIPPEIEPVEEQPTLEEQILFETKYQTLILETMQLGGIE